MPLNKSCSTLLLTVLLALTLPAAHARKDDEVKPRREQRSEQRYEQREQRAGDNGRYRIERDERRAPAPRVDRLPPPERRAPAYEQPRRYDAPRYPSREPAPQYDAPAVYPRGGLSLSDAVSQAERSTGGRVLSAQPGNDGGRAYYRIKVLNPDGRVQILYLDAD